MDIHLVKFDCTAEGAIARQLRVTYSDLINGAPEELADILRRFNEASDPGERRDGGRVPRALRSKGPRTVCGH